MTDTNTDKTIGTLTVKIEADTSQFVAVIDELTRKVEKLKAELRGLSRAEQAQSHA